MGKWQIPAKGHMEEADGLYLQNMTMKEIRDRLEKNDVIIIPVGSTENHGDNACIGEDTFLVTRTSEQVALKTGCTISQPIWFGSHPYHHMGMPGTIIVPEQTFCDYLKSVMAGLWNTGFRKMILVNGHGQEYVIPTAIHQFMKQYQVPSIIINLNWYYAVPDSFKLKPQGGVYETPFIHADEIETSWCLALFPEMIHQEWAVDTTPKGYFVKTKSGYQHLDKAGNLLNLPIKWYGHVGMTPMEIFSTPEGCVGKPKLASAEKARPGVEEYLDYLEALVNDILDKFPAGKLPPAEEMSLRPKEELEALLKKPFEKGWRSLYSVAYPPTL